MANLVPSSEDFTVWLESQTPDAKLKIFQLMDTLVHDYMSRGSVAPLGYIQYPEELGDDASAVRAFLNSKGVELLSSMRTIDRSRPREYPIFPILPYTWAARPIAKMLEVHDLNNNHLYDMVMDYEHALRLDSNLHRMNNKKVKQGGYQTCDFPGTIDEQDLADGLFNAMIDTSSIVEVDHLKPANSAKSAKSAKRKRDDVTEGEQEAPNAAEQDDEDISTAAPAYKKNYKVLRVEQASNVELQILSWKLLHAIRDAQEGNVFMPNRHGKAPRYTAFPTFMARYEAVKKALKETKSLTADMMAYDPMRRLAAAPTAEYSRKKKNKECNDARNAQVKAGKMAMAGGIYKKAADGSLKDKDGNIIAPAPLPSTVPDDGRKSKKRKTSSESSVAVGGEGDSPAEEGPQVDEDAHVDEEAQFNEEARLDGEGQVDEDDLFGGEYQVDGEDWSEEEDLSDEDDLFGGQHQEDVENQSDEEGQAEDDSLTTGEPQAYA